MAHFLRTLAAKSSLPKLSPVTLLSPTSLIAIIIANPRLMMSVSRLNQQTWLIVCAKRVKGEKEKKFI